MIQLTRVALVLLLVGGTTACPRRTPPPPPEPVVDVEAQRRAEEERLRREQAERDRLARERAEQERLAAERRRADSIAAEGRRVDELRNTVRQAVYFDYDRSEIRQDQRATMDRKIPVLQANPNLRIRVSGHTDDRGSAEYNMALGQRRAAAARRYLTDRGITQDRIDIVSFGEERPVTTGSDESAWAQNRRAEFEIVGGGDQLMSPRQ